MNFRLITKWWDVEGFCYFIFHKDVILEHFVANIVVLVLKYIGNFIENRQYRWVCFCTLYIFIVYPFISIILLLVKLYNYNWFLKSDQNL